MVATRMGCRRSRLAMVGVLFALAAAAWMTSTVAGPALLMWAIDGGHVGLTRVLLKVVPALANRATPAFESVGRRTPLQEAVIADRSAIVAALLGAGARVDEKDHLGFSALHYAADLGRRDMIALLLRHGARPAEATAMGEYAPLALAVLKRHWRAAVQLARYDHISMGAIHEAVLEGDRAKALRLISEDATAVSRRDVLQNTPLHYAVLQDNAVLVRLLLSKGSEVNAKDWLKWTPLHIVCARSNITVAQELLRAGADANATDKDYNRPLHVAACSGNVGVLQVLLQAGARLDVANLSGETPVTRARRCGRTANVSYLQNAAENRGPRD